MVCYYDKSAKRLVFINTEATSDYWDEHWCCENFEALVKNPNNHFVIGNTEKYLSKGAKILEGGCGRGDKVFALETHGYDAYGVDYAESTVSKIKEIVPELKIFLGDVRKLDFENEYFDGYWSLGVIEHFYTGYDEISKEAFRILKPNGYLFVTVPSISLLRRLKSYLGLYPEYKHSSEMEKNFYQFALGPKNVIGHFEDKGFKLIVHQPYDGVKGLKDEVDFLGPLMSKIYKGKGIIFKVIRKSINISIGRFCNHMSFFVFKKEA